MLHLIVILVIFAVFFVPGWSALAGAIDTAWLAKADTRLNVSTFNDIKPLFDSTTGIKIDVAHLMASLNALLFGASLLRPLASRI